VIGPSNEGRVGHLVAQAIRIQKQEKYLPVKRDGRETLSARQTEHELINESDPGGSNVPWFNFVGGNYQHLVAIQQTRCSCPKRACFENI